jgi:hypothetical protein
MEGALMDNNSHENFKRIVEHHKERIGRAYHKALQKLNKYPEDLRAEWTPLAVAVLMHVHTCHCMRLEFAGVPGANPKQKKGGAFILELDGAPMDIPDVAELKCKKVDQRLLTSNIPTQAVKDFHKQRPERTRSIQAALADWVAPKSVGRQEPGHGNAGYMLDALARGFERLCVTYLTGLKSATLVLEIPIEIAGEEAQIFNITVGDITEVAPRRRVKARSKKADAVEEAPKEKKRVQSGSTEAEEESEESVKKMKGQQGNGSDS